MSSFPSAQASKLFRLQSPHAYRGAIMHSIDSETLQFLPDGGLLVDETGIILACDVWDKLEQTQPNLAQYELMRLAPSEVLIPGLIDTHVHLPQVAAAGLQEADLLQWLERHIFEEEGRFSQDTYARALSDWFFKALLTNGTTTAAVFLTSHFDACQIAFESALRAGNRVIMGQNLMDRNVPSSLCRQTDLLLKETIALCEQWHGRAEGRIQYAWIPRFALTSSEALLDQLGRIRQAFPQVYLHTHLAEQIAEIEAVKRQFPWAKDYTRVYEHYGLLAPKTILAHGIHLSESERGRLHQLDCSISHCPSSNFFLKSGRFQWEKITESGLRFGLGSDVGAGPELSLFKVMKDAQYMQSGYTLSLSTLFYQATLGGARALHLEDRIGNFLPGKEADFVILNLANKDSLFPKYQTDSQADSFSAAEFGADTILSKLIYLGDDRLVQSTFIRGKRVYQQESI